MRITLTGGLLLAGLFFCFVQVQAEPLSSFEPFRHHNAVILLIDPASGEIVDANNAAASYYGYSYEQLLDRKIQQINTLSLPETEQEIRRAERERRSYFVFRHRLADGDIRPVEVYSSPLVIDGRRLLLSIIHDVSGRNSLEESLIKNEMRLRFAERVAQLGHWVLDLGTDSYHFSEGALELLGLENPVQSAPDLRRMILPEYRPQMVEAHNRLLFDNTSYDINVRFQRPDGRVIDLNSQGFYDSNENRVFGIIHDITKTQEAMRQLAARTAFYNRLAAAAVIVLLGIVALLYYAVQRSKRAEQDLTTSKAEVQESYDMTRLLLDSTAEGIYGIDRQGICMFCNSACLKILGHEQPQDLIGANIHEKIHHRHADGSPFPAEECRLVRNIDQSIHSDEELFWHTDGRGVAVEYWSHPMRRDGETVGAVVTFLDISERKAQENALRRSEERNRALVDAIPDVIFVLDETGTFTDIHVPAHAPPLLMKADRFVGRSIDETLPDTLAARVRQAMEEARHSGATSSFEYQLNTAGSERFYESRMVYMIESGFIALIRDISPRKAAENALKQKNEEMEHFVYSVSHDLKSPLVTIKSFLNMLLQDIQEQNQQQINEDVRYIAGAADRMDELLAALLALSRVGRTEGDPQTIHAAELIEQCLVSLSGSVREKQIDIRVAEIDQKLSGDPVRLGQIWQNLVENAIKYLGDQPRPRIDIGVEQRGDIPTFFVRDNGIGIDPEHAERIFALFAQLDPQSYGCGLGLPMVKKIVELHQGSVWFESEGKGKGSSFYFTLPGATMAAKEEQ
ncbi:MAG: PAS domain S-box protein [Pelovirga sp.]